MEKNDDLTLLRKLPNVLRARGFRLYLSDGKRLVDLWLNGGAAVLGHTPPNILRELKNTASRGLYSPLPHFAEGRYIKALSKIFPNRFFRLYAAPPQELSVLFNNGETKLWRPFATPAAPFAVTENVQIAAQYNVQVASQSAVQIEARVTSQTTIQVGTHIAKQTETSILIPVLPGIQTWRGGLPLGLCVIVAETEAQLANLPESDILPPVLLATATRGIHDLLATPNRATIHLQRVDKVLKNNRWQRNGIYLELKEKPKSWDALFDKFLNAGFLLPPSPSFPLILPAELSDGEEAKLAAVLSEI